MFTTTTKKQHARCPSTFSTRNQGPQVPSNLFKYPKTNHSLCPKLGFSSNYTYKLYISTYLFDLLISNSRNKIIFAPTIFPNSQSPSSISTSNRVRTKLVTKQIYLFLIFQTLQASFIHVLHSNYFSKYFMN